MIGHKEFERFMDQANVTFGNDLAEHLEAWDIEFDAYTQFLAQYSEHFADRLRGTGMGLAVMMGLILNAGFEFGYLARLEVEQQKMNAEDAELIGHAQDAADFLRDRCPATEAMARCVYNAGHEGAHLWEDAHLLESGPGGTT